MALVHPLLHRTPLPILLVSVAAAAWLDGWGTALLAVVLCGLAELVFLRDEPVLGPGQRAVLIGVLIVSSLLVAALVIGLRTARRKAVDDGRVAAAAMGRLSLLQQVTEAALDDGDLDALLSRLVERLRTGFGADTVAILLHEEGEEQLLAVRAASGFVTAEVEPGARIHPSAGFVWHVLEGGALMTIHDLNTCPIEAPLLRTEGVRSALGAPLRVDGRIIGLLHVGSRAAGRFDADDSQLLALVADRVAMIVERVRLHDAERAAHAASEATRKALDFLAEASALLATSLEQDTILTSVTRLAVPRIADGCSVHLISAGGSGPLTRVEHVDEARRRWLEELYTRFPPELSVFSPFRRVRETGRGVLVQRVPPSMLLAEQEQDERKFALFRALDPRSLIVAPLCARDRALGFLVLAIDTSARRFEPRDLELGEELARRTAMALDNAALYRQAQEAVHAREEFLSIATHELRTPLTTLYLELQRLARAEARAAAMASAGERGRGVEVAVRQAGRLARLMDSLLDVSRLAAGRLDLHIEDVDLASVARDVAQRFDAEASQAGSTVSISAVSSVEGSWDRMRLEQVVTNLLSNAIKYGDGQPIDVEIRKDAEHAELCVRDRGIGMTPEQRSRIFVPFERAVSDRKYAGTGLGLYITCQLVRAHGGSIRVESEAGRGSSFHVRLPLAPRGAEPMTSRAA
jgi:signal transduction histidine kinase